MIYFNLKTNQGTETIDELSLKDFNSFKEFREEAKRLLREYHIAGMQVYKSQKACNDWK